MLKGFNTIILDGLGLTDLPDTVIWTSEFSNLHETNVAGLMVYYPPTIGHTFYDYWVKVTNHWLPRQLVDPTWTTNLVPHEFPSYGIRMEAATALTDLKISSIPGTFDFGTPPIIPPDYLDLMTSQIDGFDTNRLNAFTTLLLGSQFPDYGRVDIQPYVSAQYAVGTTITLNAIPAPGCSFQAWSGAVSGTNNPITLTLTTNSTVNVDFEAIPGRFSSVRLEGNAVILEWPDTAILQVGSSIKGPWLDMEYVNFGPANSPFTNQINATRSFFRLRSGFGY